MHITPASFTTADKARAGLHKPRLKPRRARKKPSQGELRGKLLQQEPIHTQRAWLYAAVLPGLGQAYNQSHWKIPVIYGIFAGLAWGAIYNHKEYRKSRRELISQVGASYSLQNYVDGRKRDRDLFMIIAALWYVINIFDAYVEGKLKTFDVSDNLEIIVQPTQPPTAWHEPTIGLRLALSLKK